MSEIFNTPSEKLLINQQLKMHRLRLGLTQAELAHQLGLKSARVIRYWETGTQMPRPENARRLLELLAKSGTFVSGQELKEASSLWNALKAYHETRLETLGTYPDFDREWFKSLLNNLSTPSALFASATAAKSKQQNSGSYYIPQPANPLLGREQEVEIVCQKLNQEGVRLVTLLGIGGVGKTHLALVIATQFAALSGRQTVFVSLAATREIKLLAATIAESLNLTQDKHQSYLQNLKKFFSDKEMLLVLDNFEQLIEGATFIADLLTAAPYLKILVTSRQALRLRSEHLVEIKPLPVPASLMPLSLAELAQNPAVQLLVARAQAVSPDFLLTPENSFNLTQICVHLDGLPLALELAAPHLKLMTAQQLLSRLEHRFNLLNVASRDLPERHQSLSKMLDWSYQLLTSAEQNLLSQLAIFAGSFTLEAAIAVNSSLNNQDFSPYNVEALLGALLEKSLIQIQAQPNSDSDYFNQVPRFYMLETVREYALEQLLHQPNLLQIQQNFYNYYLKMAEAAVSDLQKKTPTGVWRLLEPERNNINAVLANLIQNNNQFQLSFEMHGNNTYLVFLRLVTALWQYWLKRGYYKEARYWVDATLDYTQFLATEEPFRQLWVDLVWNLERVNFNVIEAKRNLMRLQWVEQLAKDSDIHSDWYVRNQFAIGRWYFTHDYLKEALEYFGQVQEFAEQTNNHELAVNTYAVMGRVLTMKGEFAASEALLRKALPTLEHASNWTERIVNVAFEAVDIAAQGQYQAGVAELKQALDYALQSKNAHGEIICRLNLTFVYIMGEDWQDAIDEANNIIRVAIANREFGYLCSAYGLRAWAECENSEYKQALDSWNKWYEAAETLGGNFHLSHLLPAVGSEIFFQNNQLERSLNLISQTIKEAQAAENLMAEGVAHRINAKILFNYWLATEGSLNQEQWSQIETHLANSLKVFKKGQWYLQALQTYKLAKKLATTSGNLLAAQNTQETFEEKL